MIIKLSVIGTMEDGKTKTASVSNKGMIFRNKDCQVLYEKVKQRINNDRNMENANILEAIISMVMVMDYEMTVGKFKDCSL